MRGAHGWAALAAGILVWDLLAPEGETLTAVAHRKLHDRPFTVISLVVATALHLTVGHDPRYRHVDAFGLISILRRLTRDQALGDREALKIRLRRNVAAAMSPLGATP